MRKLRFCYLVDGFTAITLIAVVVCESCFFLASSILEINFTYQLLKTVPGIGANLLIQMSAEIGDYTRFKTAKQFVAYIGLDPSFNYDKIMANIIQ